MTDLKQNLGEIEKKVKYQERNCEEKKISDLAKDTVRQKVESVDWRCEMTG